MPLALKDPMPLGVVTIRIGSTNVKIAEMAHTHFGLAP